jgi:hypothetical protein
LGYAGDLDRITEQLAYVLADLGDRTGHPRTAARSTPRALSTESPGDEP